MNRRKFVASIAGSAAGSILPWRLFAQASDTSAKAARIASDPLRPSFHLLPPHNWMNDPNGPIWWKGQYHLFYQLNPHAAVWGDMHWGNAVSPDMVRWKHQPIALAPTPGGPDSEGCFSGSAVVFDGVPTFLYTGVQNAPPEQVTLHDGSDRLRETLLLATAEDDGLLRWKKRPEPVIPTPPSGLKVTGFRDPFLWRDNDLWYLGIGSGERGTGGFVLLYASQDLREWRYLHKLAEGKPNGTATANPCDSGEMWECPDFFALADRHCLFYSTENRVIWTTGEYKAATQRYSPKREGVLDHGTYYAPKSFHAPDGRRILWGWIREARPESEFAAAGWAGCMSLPRVLTIGAQRQLEMNPAKEVEAIRGPMESAHVDSAHPFRRSLQDLRYELQAPIDIVAKSAMTVRLKTSAGPVWQLTLDVPGNEVRCGDIRFRLPEMSGPHPHLRIFLDGSVMESFLGGREAITSRVYAVKPGETAMEVELEGAGTTQVTLWKLASISPDRMSS